MAGITSVGRTLPQNTIIRRYGDQVRNKYLFTVFKKRIVALQLFNIAMKTRGATIIVLMTVFTQAICAPQAKGTMGKIATDPKSPQSPANLSYEELLFILQARRGGEPEMPKLLSPCARAILGCCREKVMNPDCSELLNCGAFFFDVNPCEDKFVVDALNAAKNFYGQFNSVTR